MSTKARIYSDSCCFIEAVKHRRGLPLSGDAEEVKKREEDCWYFRKLCDASRDGVIQLVTSMLSVAECLHVSEPDGPSKETRDLFLEFLTSGTIVDLVEPDLFVAERARDLVWNDGIYLGGADCLHVATALLDGCVEFLTLDGKIRKQQKFATAIPQLKNIGLAVLRPSQTSYLPSEYRSDDLFTGTTSEEA
jgi:predicted nucleic acid-binding protein